MFNKAAFLIGLTILASFAGITFFKASNNKTNGHLKAVGAFEQWMKIHGKNYQSPEEKNYRLSIFFKNLVKVEYHNRVNTDFKIEINQFSDLTKEEFKTKYLGYRFSERVKNYVPHTPSNVANPTSVDWRTKGAVNPVKNQGQCGSCWAFSTVTSIETQWFLKKGHLLSLSEQQLVDCSSSYGNHGCNGGLMDNAFNYVKAKGITTESDYPYTAVTGSCEYSGHASATISGHTDVERNNGEALETAVTSQVISIAVDAESWSSYSSGIYSKYCGTQLDHGVGLVGYGVEDGKDYWIVRNSWSASWGESGYIRLKKTTSKNSGECGINMMPSYPTV